MFFKRKYEVQLRLVKIMIFEKKIAEFMTAMIASLLCCQVQTFETIFFFGLLGRNKNHKSLDIARFL
jgi:hypothetical protein